MEILDTFLTKANFRVLQKVGAKFKIRQFVRRQAIQLHRSEKKSMIRLLDHLQPN